MPPHSEAVRIAVYEYLRQRLQSQGSTGNLNDQSMLWDTGLLDSLALIGVVTAVEEKLGTSVDMLMVDPMNMENVAELIDQLVQAAA